MQEFKSYHPIVNFTYFVFVIVFSCLFLHPICLGISLASGIIYSSMLKGKKAMGKSLIYIIPVMILMALMNPIFNHQGMTILAYLPDGNPVTLESIAYGLSAAAMILGVIFHFSSYNEIISSDKFIYLFGKIIPSLSLIISMTLRFIPRFFKELKVVRNAQRCMGRDINKGSVIKRAKNGINILSIMTTWALENSIETADSMKARGYGIPGRTAYSIYKFERRDKKALIFMLALGTYVLVGKFMGAMYFRYFPSIKGTGFNIFSVSVFLAYLMLFIFPVIIELWEVRKWK